MGIEEITSAGDYRKATNEDGPVVIDAYATWCGPCKQMMPVVTQMSDRDELSHVRFYKFDIDKVPDVAHELGISQVPSFNFFKDGMIQEGFTGANVKKLEECVKAIA